MDRLTQHRSKPSGNRPFHPHRYSKILATRPNTCGNRQTQIAVHTRGEKGESPGNIVLHALHRVQFATRANGKLERYHRTLKEQAIRPKTPLTLEDAKRVVGDFIYHYNHIRLHSAIGYIAPMDRLAGRHLTIFADRDKKLETAREARRIKRQQLTN